MSGRSAVAVDDARTVLVTGAAVRIGAGIARTLHAAGLNVIVHYRHSQAQAAALVLELNTLRAGSSTALACDLADVGNIEGFATQCMSFYGRIDLLVNNASVFEPHSFESTSHKIWNNTLASNLQAPYFLTQALLESLRENKGCVINIVDIHAQSPLKNYSAYCIAKAGLEAMTRSLALELAPNVRVNGVSPGAILWPEKDEEKGEKSDDGEFAESNRERLLTQIPMQRLGSIDDISSAVEYLALRAPYVTGQILAIDGGRSV